jgi:hypothetical protein
VCCALAVACAAASCGGDSGDSGTAEKPASGASAAAITTFEVPPSVACPSGETSTTVSVQYTVSNSTRNRLIVDGLDAEGVDMPSGTVEVPVHCDPLPHTVVLVVYDEQGRKTSQEKTVTTTTS